MSDGSLRPWLLLRDVRGLAPGALCRLVQGFGSPEAVLEASEAALREVGELSSHGVEAVRSQGRPHEHRDIDEELRALERHRTTVTTFLDPTYPLLLRAIPDPPLLLSVTGRVLDADRHAVAVVGSRRATPTGRLITQELSRELASLGFTIVSGLAYGVDAAAHKGALEAKGRTLAVLGCGIDRTYPSQHRGLRSQIEGSGAVLSEFPLGAPPLAHHFPRRNRIISGLSLGVLVTEAAARSGSLITARLAAEQGREVFAVPGSVRVEQSRGPHSLIKQGAKLVETVQDIVEELLPQLDDSLRARLARKSPAQSATQPQLEGEEAIVYELLSHEPTQLDDVIAESRLPAGRVAGLLLALELKGLVHRLPGSSAVRV